jgi:hypothetical protein
LEGGLEGGVFSSPFEASSSGSKREGFNSHRYIERQAAATPE